MEAKYRTDGEIVLVELKGFMNFETIAPFRHTCVKNFKDKKVVIDLRGLHFVGSSGLTSLVDAVRDLKLASNEKVKLCGLSTEFRRLFIASDISGLEIYENEEKAKMSFYSQVETIHFIEDSADEGEEVGSTDVELETNQLK